MCNCRGSSAAQCTHLHRVVPGGREEGVLTHQIPLHGLPARIITRCHCQLCLESINWSLFQLRQSHLALCLGLRYLPGSVKPLLDEQKPTNTGRILHSVIPSHALSPHSHFSCVLLQAPDRIALRRQCQVPHLRENQRVPCR